MAIPNQVRYNDPYQQRLLQFNTQDSKVYLSRSTNYLLKAIGDDVVLNGLSLTVNPTIDLETISLTISPGLLIQDTTLISILDSTTLTFNVRPYDQNNGYIIVYTEYQYLNIISENPLSLKIAYISADGTSISTSWDPNKNRILLYRFSFTKLPEAALSSPLDAAFEIFNVSYTPFGLPNFTNFTAQILDHSSDSPTYGYASETKAGHVRIGENISISNGTISIQNASTTNSGVIRTASQSEAFALESSSVAITPSNLRDLIINLKDIEFTVVDPGITLGTALILS